MTELPNSADASLHWRLDALHTVLSPVSIQTALQTAVALASSQSWLPLLRPSIPIGWRLRQFSFTQRTQRKRLRLNGNRALDLRQP